ncbi:MAG TPA: hypothetical protein VFV99_05380 [Kofleriaceae bacterium]|nr:hypothetical protein [Kofleriaceae bacterium]
MKRVVALLVAFGLVAALIAWRMWPHGETHAAAPSSPSSATQPGATSTAQSSRVRKLSPEQRRELGDKIAAAIERARTAQAASTSHGTSAGSAPALPEPPSIPLEEAAKPLQEALQDAIPLLADCFEQHADNRAAAMMTMTSDPDLGTVIDTAAITDKDGKPLEPKVDECLRNAIDSLALPPLGAQAGLLKVQYTFRFDE